ncbi:MAG: hypothetical protein M0D57_07925 [Sphingobacteriales bacterium JAD_PAG50586_3]|nr:MAG: hypothetical protein M0D57_07925 [Sphingobacteriales bacterium JAD_PAG50586_3]
MLKTLFIVFVCLFIGKLHAQTANSADNWKITFQGDTATYHLKLVPDIDIHGYSVKLKRDATAKFYKLEVARGGTQTDVVLYDGEKSLGAIQYWAGDDVLPYFDITNLKPGKYMLHMMACNNGGFIQFELE